ncbi:MAG: efflux RND transporter periplasmic adaptor subunit [Nitrospiria bacterium]
MTKRMFIMLGIAALILGGIFGFQLFKAKMMKKFFAANQAPPVAVTAMKADFQTWKPSLNAVGSLRAVHGTDVTGEIAGLVRTVNFKSGDEVREGQVLVQLNADADIAQLKSLESLTELARTLYERDKAQFAVQAVSQATVDTDAFDFKSKQAQVAQQAALVEKKTIRAPFSGRLGISTITPGQYVNPGDKIVTLQSLDPIYVDFFVPQQKLTRISLGQSVRVTTDTYPGRSFAGKVTVINPKVDTETRNIQLEAVIPNPRHELLPGMFASVNVEDGAEQRYLTLPQTAVTFNPYGETVYIVEEGKEKDGKPAAQTVRQTFVKVGETRGDQVAILDGIKPGDMVATSGQLKLRNGSGVVINNKVQPSNDISPKPVDQ